MLAQGRAPIDVFSPAAPTAEGSALLGNGASRYLVTGGIRRRPGPARRGLPPVFSHNQHITAPPRPSRCTRFCSAQQAE
jgi:hypothetical protein